MYYFDGVFSVMSYFRLRSLTFLLFLFASVAQHAAYAQAEERGGANDIYKMSQQAVYQVRIIDIRSDAKSVIGSGFRIEGGNFFATNYHVVSEVVHDPDRYRIEFINADGETGTLIIKAIDVVNDLAVLLAETPGQSHLLLSEGSLQKGRRIFSMGNPLDLGMMIIEGTYNGVQEDSFHERILFSGALNPGMSGGPGLDEQGRVIGVNVAITGNDISYLVPVSFLKALVEKAKNAETTQETVPDWKAEIQSQLYANQEIMIDRVLANEWTTTSSDGLIVPKEMLNVLKCSGSSHPEEDDYTHSHNMLGCDNDNRIYLTEDLYTGYIYYFFESFQSEMLNTAAFSKYHSGRFASPSHYAGDRLEKDMTQFECRTRFVDLADRKWKMAFCVRAYKDYPLLYDVITMGTILGTPQQGKVFELDLVGVGKEKALAFLERFMGAIQ